MRDWLRTGAIDDDPELLADLTGVEYGYGLRDGRDAIQLERKEDMTPPGARVVTTRTHWPYLHLSGDGVGGVAGPASGSASC